jgi:hypothetical protein
MTAGSSIWLEPLPKGSCRRIAGRGRNGLGGDGPGPRALANCPHRSVWGAAMTRTPQRATLGPPSLRWPACRLPRCWAHSTPLRARVVLPTPDGPVITAPRLAATAVVNWESSLPRPTIGHPITLKGTWAMLLDQGPGSMSRARDLQSCTPIPTVAVSRSSGLPAPGPYVTDTTGQ